VLSKLSTLAYRYLQLQSSVIFATSLVGRDFLLLHSFNGQGLYVKLCVVFRVIDIELNRFDALLEYVMFSFLSHVHD
jgi:hypothetical protein